MNIYTFYPKLVWLLLTISSALHAADLKPPQQAIQNLSDDLYKALHVSSHSLNGQADYAQQIAKNVVAPYVDFQRLAKLALGRHWHKVSKNQQQRFTDSFKTRLVNSYSYAFHLFSDWEIRHFPMTFNQTMSDVMVRTEILRQHKKPLSVYYQMHKMDKQWRIYEVKIENFGLISHYRTGFNRIIKKQGIEALIKHLHGLNGTPVNE